jgi:transposase
MIAYHPRAKTTIEIRKEIKENQEGLTVREQAKKYNVSTKTIMKWRKRDNPYDEKHGTKDLYKNHIKITPLEEYIICEIRKTALLGLDDLLEVVNSIGIKINRSALHRALQRNGLSKLNEIIENLDKKSKKEIKEFKNYPPGFLHIDIKVLPKIDKKRSYLFVAIDRATRWVYIEIKDNKDAKTSSEFLKNLVKYYPFKITKILTDNGGEFTNKMHYKYQQQNKQTKTITPKLHPFDEICKKHNIEHRLTKPYTPKTNGMVERFNKKIDDNVLDTIKFNSIQDMKNTIYQYVYNYNHYIKHSRIQRKTPIEKLKEYYKTKPEIFTKTIEKFIEYDNNIFNYSVGLDK